VEKFVRGFRLIKQHQAGTFGVYLFRINGNKYLVSIHYFFFTLMYKKKNYHFLHEEDALRFFDKATHRLAG
jgi:hypothetical protein